MDQRRSYIVLSSADINAKKKLVVHPTVRPPIVPLQVKDEPIQRNDVFLTAFHDYASSDHDNQSEDDNKPPRKKACLAQLSEDEKNLRRKMKNRESAQTARDRKKCYLESLEKRVNELEQEKLTLHQAKQFVDEKCSNLEDENRKLRQQLLQGDVGNSGFVKKDPKADVSHWESVCRQLMAEKEELKIKVQELEEKLNGSAVAELASCSNDQLEHFYPIESEVEVKTCEESSESAALEVSPQQSHFLRALTMMVSLLLLSTKFHVASRGSMTLLEHVLRQTYEEQLAFKEICPKDPLESTMSEEDQILEMEAKEPP